MLLFDISERSETRERAGGDEGRGLNCLLEAGDLVGVGFCSVMRRCRKSKRSFVVA